MANHHRRFFEVRKSAHMLPNMWGNRILVRFQIELVEGVAVARACEGELFFAAIWGDHSNITDLKGHASLCLIYLYHFQFFIKIKITFHPTYSLA
jgi:hypothetical protein